MIEFTWTTGFDFFSEEYEALFLRSAATAFQHPLWLDGVYSRLVKPSDGKPAILVGHRRSDQELVYVLPMVNRRFGPLTVAEYADMGVTDYCCPVFDPSHRAVFDDSAASHRQALKASGPFIVSRLQKLKAEHVDQPDILGTTRHTFMGLHAHEVYLRMPFSHWRETALSDSFRRFLTRKRKLLQKKADLRFEEADNPAAIRDALVALRAFHGQRWNENFLENEAYFNFYTDIACRGRELGIARTYTLSAGDTLAGVLFGISHHDRFMLLLMGVNYDAFRNYSVGLLMTESAIADCIGRGDKVFDLTIGDEAFKRKFAATRTPMMTLWSGSKPLSALAQLILQWRAKGFSRKAGGGSVQYAFR